MKKSSSITLSKAASQQLDEAVLVACKGAASAGGRIGGLHFSRPKRFAAIIANHLLEDEPVCDYIPGANTASVDQLEVLVTRSLNRLLKAGLLVRVSVDVPVLSLSKRSIISRPMVCYQPANLLDTLSKV